MAGICSASRSLVALSTDLVTTNAPQTENRSRLLKVIPLAIVAMIAFVRIFERDICLVC